MGQIQTFAEFFRMLRRRAVIIIAITLLGAVASLYYAMQQQKLYQATGVIQIETAQIVNPATGLTVNNGAAHRLRLIEQRLMSRDNLLGVIQKFGLFEGGSVPIEQQLFLLRTSVEIRQIISEADAWRPNATPTGLLISATMPDPVQAADITNEFLSSVVRQNQSRQSESARETVAFFASEEERLNAEISALETTLANFKTENAASLPSNLASQRDQFTALQESELELDQQIIQLQSDTSRQRRTVVENQINQLNLQKANIQGRILVIESALSRAPEVERELGSLERQMQQLQEQYSIMTQSRAQAEMSQMLENTSQSERFEILETALVPEHSVSTSRKKLAIAGTLAAFIGAMVVAFVLELINPAIRSASQLERELGISPFVTIPRIQTRWEHRRAKYMRIATIAAVAIGIPVLLRVIGEKIGILRLPG